MSVQYKFKAAVDYSTVTFDGVHISVNDLKKEIIEQKQLEKNVDFDLQIQNAQTEEVYADENALIPENTSVIVARVPSTEKKTEPSFGKEIFAHQQRANLPPASAVNGVDSTPMDQDETEDENIKAIVSTPVTNGFGMMNGTKLVSPVAQTPKSPKPHSSPSPIAKRPRYMFDEFKEDNEPEANKGQAKVRRLNYLLEKSEFFAHCLSSGDAVVAAKRGRKSKAEQAAAAEGSSRHRKTEKEEDEELLKNAEAPVDGSGIHSAAVTFMETPPYIKNGEMRDYQIRGLNWLVNLYENGINGILADEMGLGKTLQTISLLGYLKNYKNVRGHYLVILPKSTLCNWENEFKRWCPSMRTVTLLGDAEARKAVVQNRLLHLNAWDVLLTTYEMILKEKATLKKINWTYLIIDEAHRIKNEHSKLSESVRELGSRHRLLLTGTPLQNNLHELWALLNFLLPDVFDSSENFDDWFNTESCFGDNSLVTRLHSVLRPFLLRRIKSDVEKSLLPKKEIKVYVPMVAMQRLWYKKILMKDLDVINGAGKMEKVRLMNILMHLRKCSNHPYLFDGAEPGPPYTTDSHLVTNSGKLMVLDKLLPKLKSEGSRVLIFSQMTRLLDILEDYFFWRRFSYHRLDGQTAHEDRQRMIDEYNTPGSQTFVFMLSTRAGGLGINLASADVVIIMDSDWNPQVDLQAMDRAHRIGQKKQVRVFRLITENTVDEKIVERAAIKLKLDKLVIQQGRLVDANTQLKKEEMLNWIRYGANLVFSAESGSESIPDDTIEAILERSKSKEDELTGKLDGLEDSNLRNFALESSIFSFEGEDYQDKNKARDRAMVAPTEWIEPPKRERKAAVYAETMFYKDSNTKDEEWKPKNPKPARHPTLPEHQFFPKRLHDLLQMEVYYYQQTIKYKIPREQWNDSKDAIKQQKAEQKKIDNARPLTDAEIEEKEILLEQGFTTWNRKDFNLFLKLVEKHGRDDMESVAEEFEGKTKEEVLLYAKVFIRRFSELKNSDKILLQIGKSEEKRMRKTLVERVLTERISKCRKPLLELRIPYTKQCKMGNFTAENDRFLISTWYKYGFDTDSVETWFNMREEILKSTEFRFDWFLKSRSSDELRRRCQMIWSLMEKDIVTEDEIANLQKKMKQAWADFARKANALNNDDDETDTSPSAPPTPPPTHKKRSKKRRSTFNKKRKSASSSGSKTRQLLLTDMDIMNGEDSSQHSKSSGGSSSRKSTRTSSSRTSSSRYQ